VLTQIITCFSANQVGINYKRWELT